MLRFISFSSGSCGNCYYIGDGQKGLFVDAGISFKNVQPMLFKYGINLDSINAILVTHDHLDHIKGLRSFAKKGHWPIYAPAKLHAALAFHTFTKDFISSYRRFLNEDVTEIAGFKVRWVEVPHDATMTVAYQIEYDGYRFFIMTDTGQVIQEAIDLASESKTVVIESNYDVEMLKNGPYDYLLKQRILSSTNGHISNDQCAEGLRQIWHDELEHIFLCHRSDNNNTEELAVECNRKALEEIDAFEKTPDLTIECLKRNVLSGPYTLIG